MPDGQATTETAPRRRGAMVFILVTLFINVLGIGVVIPVLPELVKQMVGGDVATAGRYVGVIAASYATMQFFFAPLLGALSDRFGRRPVILVSLFGLGIDYLIQGFAPTIGWLFAGRVLAGIMGASFSTANAYIADVSDPPNRARNYGLIGVVFGLGFIVGPALGGLLGGIHLRLPTSSPPVWRSSTGSTASSSCPNRCLRRTGRPSPFAKRTPGARSATSGPIPWWRAWR